MIFDKSYNPLKKEETGENPDADPEEEEDAEAEAKRKAELRARFEAA